MPNTLSDLERRISQIEQRNARVELDKKWEQSSQRKLIIAVSTYVLIVIYLYLIGANRPLVNAIVPTVGFYLSTLVIAKAKSNWLARQPTRKD